VRALVTAAIVAALLGSSGVDAQAVYSHAVQEGDTFASVAQRYYGDPTREAVLREANRMKGVPDEALVPGTWLFVPVVSFYRVGKDETWRSLSSRFYGSEGRAAVLIDANRGNRRMQPDEGAELLIPYPLRHVVAPGETLAKIAKLYMPDSPTSLKRLRQFNAGARIERGKVALVPLYDLRLAGDGRAEATEAFVRAAGGGAAKEAQDAVEEELPTLIRQVEGARFAEAVALGNRLLGAQGLTSTQAVTIQKELGVAYVALDRADLAEASFRAALSLQPNLELDTVRTSPRVLEAFTRAKQPVAP
jgi:hypothetical protein